MVCTDSNDGERSYSSLGRQPTMQLVRILNILSLRNLIGRPVMRNKTSIKLILFFLLGVCGCRELISGSGSDLDASRYQ